MLASVRCSALRPAPAQLRGAARPVSAPQRAALALRGSQRAAFRVLDRRGPVVRLVAAAAVPEPGPAAPRGRGRPRKTADSETAPPPRKRKAPVSNDDGETPTLDERTVAYLARPGWFKTEKDAAAMLTRASPGGRDYRYSFVTASGNGAKAVADWLEMTLGPAPVKDDRCPAAQVVKSQPLLLTRDTATLQLKWDALVLSPEQGGIGIMFTQEQAREAFLKFPTILGYAADNLRNGWSMLTATEGGLGLTHDEARKSILRNPHVLTSDFEKFTKRVELLRSLGYADAHSMVLKRSAVLNFKDETVQDLAAWWSQTGLDHVKLITSQATLLGGVPIGELHAKLDFLRRVAGLSDAELSNASSFFTCSLDGRLRPRFFYALQKGALYACSMSTLMTETDASYVAFALGRRNGRVNPASEEEVECYKEAVSSPAFLEWAAQEEARRKGGAH